MFRQCDIFLLGFGNVPAVRYFFAFHFISITESRYHFVISNHGLDHRRK
jgi:hypothetical protein